jgi:hypothetical protein
MFHASASVSRWRKNQYGKYERATIAGIHPASGAGKQSVVAYQCETLHCDKQGGTNTSAIDCEKPLWEMVRSFPLFSRPYYERQEHSRRYRGGSSEYSGAVGSAPLVIDLALHNHASSNFLIADDCENARIECKAQYA